MKNFTNQQKQKTNKEIVMKKWIESMSLLILFVTLCAFTLTPEKCSAVTKCVDQKQKAYLAAHPTEIKVPDDVMKTYKHDCDCQVTGQASDQKPCTQ